MNCPACGEPHACDSLLDRNYHECAFCGATFDSFGTLQSYSSARRQSSGWGKE